MNTPILFLIFNRSQCTRRVFEQIRKVRPAKLYVSADGPRTHVAGDIESCRLARQIIEEVDWKCTVKTYFRAENAGCKRAVKSGIDWFFEHEEAGIILEDDCLPDPSFFNFCEETLKKYADDERIMHISGHNPAMNACRKMDSSYVYSKFSMIWGWATWRRAWKYYDGTFTDLESHWRQSGNAIANLVSDKTACRYMLDKFQRTRDGQIDTWDYAWFYTIIARDGWCVNPVFNLIENIGFNRAATHTGNTHFWRMIKVKPMEFPLREPGRLSRDAQIEISFFHVSQKGYWGLLLRRFAPSLFFKPLAVTTENYKPEVWRPQPV